MHPLHQILLWIVGVVSTLLLRASEVVERACVGGWWIHLEPAAIVVAEMHTFSDR